MLIEQTKGFLATLDLAVPEDEVLPAEVDLIEQYLAEVIHLYFDRAGAEDEPGE